MRETNLFPGTAGERMVGSLGEIKDAELFVTQRMAADAVAVQNACVRRQTRQDRRCGIAFGPVQNAPSKQTSRVHPVGRRCRGSVPVMITPSNRLFQRSSMPK